MTYSQPGNEKPRKRLLTAQLPLGIEGLELHKEAPGLQQLFSVEAGPAEVGKERK